MFVLCFLDARLLFSVHHHCKKNGRRGSRQRYDTSPSSSLFCAIQHIHRVKSRELSSKATSAMKRSAVNDSADGSAQLRKIAAGRLDPMTCWACADRTSAPGSTSETSPATTLGVFAARACIAAREAKCRGGRPHAA